MEKAEISPTQERIMQSAREIFLSKGMDGARMQEIADHAGINKALLHYYYRNKETLFYAVFNQVLMEILPALTDLFRSERPLLEKISDFFFIHMGFIQANPKLPHFLFSELARDPGIILKGFSANSLEGLFAKFSEDVRASIENGEIKPIDPVQLLLNLVSLSVFPFIAKPLLVKILDLDDSQFAQLVEQRKAATTNFVINGLT